MHSAAQESRRLRPFSWRRFSCGFSAHRGPKQLIRRAVLFATGAPPGKAATPLHLRFCWAFRQKQPLHDPLRSGWKRYILGTGKSGSNLQVTVHACARPVRTQGLDKTQPVIGSTFRVNTARRRSESSRARETRGEENAEMTWQDGFRSTRKAGSST